MKPLSVANEVHRRRDWRDGFRDLVVSPTPPRSAVLPCEDDDVCVPIHCSECLKRIPVDEMASPEGEDYVRHFCGLNCLRRWEARRAQFTRD